MKSLIICLLIAILFAITFVTATTSSSSYYGEKTINSLLTELRRIKKWKRQQQVNVNNNLSDRRGFGGFRAPTRRPSFRPRPRPVHRPRPIVHRPRPVHRPVHRPIIHHGSGAGNAIANNIVGRIGGNTRPSGYCARSVRQAIEAATGRSIQRVGSAKDYGPSLINAGFRVVNGQQPQIGDVAIFQSVPGHPHGHMQVYTANGWYSDFKQRDQFPGSAYRNVNAPMTLYRL
ncbi:hypothetical protein ABK040_013330 [Willaertia magna]